jgi:hypothetical protein
VLQVKSQPVFLQVGIAFVGDIHAVPHLPQLEVSLVRSTHEPSQAVSVPQSLAHTPDLQSMPVPHTVVQSPQCCPFDCVSTHLPLQSV